MLRPGAGTIVRPDDAAEAALNTAQRLLVLICAAACHSAQADRSRLTAEEDVIERGDCEVEAAFQRKTARDTAAERESSIHVGCGIGWRTELAATFARKSSDGAHERAIDIEGATSLRTADVGRVGWKVLYGFGAERSGEGGSWRHTERLLAVEATLQPVQRWLIEATVGTRRERIARRDSTLWGLAVEHAITDSVEARAEVAGDDRDRPFTGIALRYLFWPDKALATLTYGVTASPVRVRRIGIGVTFEF